MAPVSAPAATPPRDPPRTLGGILKSIGPGLILTANIVGTGELIATTKLGAEVGFTLLWFILLGCFIKVFVQVELGRASLCDGVGSLQILDRLPGPRLGVRWAVWFWFAMYLGTLCQMAGMVGGVAELLARASGGVRLWALLVAASAAGILVLGRYAVVEKSSMVMVVVFTLCNLLAALLLQGTRWAVGAGDLASGLSFGLPPDLTTAFMAFGITGVGAAELMFYPIWCLEKGYAKACGPRDDSPAWMARAKGWMRVMRWDAWLSMGVYTVGTISFSLLGAAILHRQGKRIEDGAAVENLEHMYTETFGPSGAWIFFLGAGIVLYSTYFVSTASNARLFADLGGLLKWFRYPTPEHRMKVVKAAIVGIAVLTCALYLTRIGLVTLVSIGAIAQALMLPFLGFAALHGRARIPAELRARPAWTAFLVASFLLMAALGIQQTQAGLWKILNLLRS
jgi:manganese transport protein